MAFTEFCCKSGGSNLNAGTRTGSSTEPGVDADFTYASGNWVAGTGVFTVASGNPLSDGVAVGDFASVYADGSTVTGFVGRVTARDATTITVSLTAKAGTAPTDGTGNRTLKIGGAWQGPNGADLFPLSIGVLTALMNIAGDKPRINFKNNQTYIISSGISTSSSIVTYMGYNSTYGDLGKATFTTGAIASFIIWTTLGANRSEWFCDLIFDGSNFTSGSSDGVSISPGMMIRCVFHSMRGSGLMIGGFSAIVECEAYNNNRSNTTSKGGFATTNSTVGLFVRCISHDNTGSNTDGFFLNCLSGSVSLISCVADTNGKSGVNVSHGSSNGSATIQCDSYNNTSHGIQIGSTSQATYIYNCNLIKNGGYGISTGVILLIHNVGFGAGTQANTSGTISGNVIENTGTVTYASNITPWVDPANGDFRINLTEAKGAGRGAFTQTATGYTGTIGYPDIGAAQHLEQIEQLYFMI